MKRRLAARPRVFVAPARERGLKSYSLNTNQDKGYCRSREGAWIEITCGYHHACFLICRSREGAWIEITCGYHHACFLICRSREGAWIEIALSANYNLGEGVAPARERGLKYDCTYRYETYRCRSREGAWIEIFLGSALGSVAGGVAPARERGLKFDLRFLSRGTE